MKKITESPYREIISEEWKRCKPLAKALNRKPSFYWGNAAELNGAYARASWYHNLIKIRETYKLLKDDHKEFRETIRHELAHIAAPRDSHGADFLFFMRRFGGTRHVAHSAVKEISRKRKIV